MNCENYLKFIDDLVEGELDELTAEKVSLHIFDCPNCSAQVEILEREKEMYSHYLFEIEPPSNLLEKFQAKLEVQKPQTVLTARTSFNPVNWLSELFGSLRLNTAFAAVVVLILLTFGFGLFSLVNEEKPSMEKAAESKQNFPAVPMMLPKITEDKEVMNPEDEKVGGIAKNVKERSEPALKPIPVKQVAEVRKEERKTKIQPEVIKVSEEDLQMKEIQTLELETAKQLEKVELLLRSFRNARLIDGSEVYDISFEKQQARKLLQNNIALRQKAEIYGTIFTEELLSKVEPYLLDIANLEITSTPEQVLEIKERVRNQNIIATLQGF